MVKREKDLLAPRKSRQSRDFEGVSIPEQTPLFPARDMVLFPYMIAPLRADRIRAIGATQAAIERYGARITIVTQRRGEIEDPTDKDLYEVGTLASITRASQLPDGQIKFIAQGLRRARIEAVEKRGAHSIARIKLLDKTRPYRRLEKRIELEAMARSTLGRLERIFELGGRIDSEIVTLAENIDDEGKLADLISANVGFRLDQAQATLETVDPIARLKLVCGYLDEEISRLELERKIKESAKIEMSKTQREYFLRERMKAIQKELGQDEEKGNEIEDFRRAIESSGMGQAPRNESIKQLNRLEKMSADSAEATTVRTYLEWMIELPWSARSEETLDLPRARAIMDEDHYGLDEVKERIIEFLATIKLKGRANGPILCLIGPPGVGKTSLGQSVARAMGREFARVSLGGMRDEAEIRGHRRTYVGAMPGKIISSIKSAGKINPLFMLDEIDKLGSDARGDPASALLEALDETQNQRFVDHYLGVEYDLSEVLFIATANRVDTIPAALLDRLEPIEICAYDSEQKSVIARRHLIPAQLSANGISALNARFSDAAINRIIDEYTRESGVRSLQRAIGSICRKIARSVAMDNSFRGRITSRNVSSFLGPARGASRNDDLKGAVGVATGAAWTATGGELLKIESAILPGSGSLIVTGNVGDVMRESARAALSYIQSNAERFKIDRNFLAGANIHIHAPAGAIPKDGPSAGAPIATALLSALKQTPTRSKVAMTGEITLRGEILPIGGLREKALAAARAKVKIFIAPEANKDQFDEIPGSAREMIEFRFVRHLDEIFKFALQEKKRPDRPENLSRARTRNRPTPRRRKSARATISALPDLKKSATQSARR